MSTRLQARVGHKSPWIWAASWAIAASTARRDGRPALQTFVPKRNSALWRPLDCRLSDLAVLVWTVTESEVDVVWKRTRDCECNPAWGCCLDRLSVG